MIKVINSRKYFLSDKCNIWLGSKATWENNALFVILYFYYFPVMNCFWAMRSHLPLEISQLSLEEAKITTFVPRSQRVDFQRRLKWSAWLTRQQIPTYWAELGLVGSPGCKFHKIQQIKSIQVVKDFSTAIYSWRSKENYLVL